MIRLLACLSLLLLWTAAPLLADESVRQVQEELRKRNLYFGDIDGENTPEVIGALKRYQKRKGFTVTGTIDPDTAASLHMHAAAVSASQASAASTQASEASSQSTTVIASSPPTPAHRDPFEWADLPKVPEPPAEAPPASPDISPERVNQFVEAYLRDAETNDIYLQAWFYDFPVDYFQEGLFDQKALIKDLQYHVKDWPERKYMLLEPASILPSDKEGEITVEFSIAYTRRKKKGATSGKAKYTWKVRAHGEELRIVSVREQILPNTK